MDGPTANRSGPSQYSVLYLKDVPALGLLVYALEISGRTHGPALRKVKSLEYTLAVVFPFIYLQSLQANPHHKRQQVYEGLSPCDTLLYQSVFKIWPSSNPEFAYLAIPKRRRSVTPKYWPKLQPLTAAHHSRHEILK